MKRVVVVVAAVLLLSGCATQTPVQTHSPKPALTGAAKIDAEEKAGDVPPQCRTLVGQRTADVLDSKGSPFCITGTSLSTDKTVRIETNCDPVHKKSTPIYGWFADDDVTLDQQVYAAKKGGVVVIVPNTADVKKYLGGVPVADYLVAVGCP